MICHLSTRSAWRFSISSTRHNISCQKQQPYSPPRFRPPYAHSTEPERSGSVHRIPFISPIRFMQSEFPATSTPASTEPNLVDSASSDQHGLHNHDTGGVALPPEHGATRVETGTGSAADQLALDAALAASLQESGRGAGSERRRLSPAASPGSMSPTPATPSAAKRNRIEEYENASTPPVGKKREGPAFEVLKKPRAPGDKRSPFTELPNGMAMLRGIGRHTCKH